LNDAIQNLRVLLVGGYPPPYGGVTVHIQRLQHYLNRAGANCLVLNQFRSEGQPSGNIINLSGGRLAQYFKMRALLTRTDAQIIHFHFSKLGNFLIGGRHLIKAAGKAICVATCHSGQLAVEFAHRHKFYRLAAIDLIRAFDHLIAVNPQQVEFYTKVIGIEAIRVSLIPTFILPESSQIELPQAMLNKVTALRKCCRWILMVSGYLLPYYGFDLFLEAVANLERLYHAKFGLIFIFYTKADENYRQLLLAKIEKHGCSLVYENIKPNDFLGLLQQSDLFVRPTLADSFGVSVAEALYLGTPVVASDVCARQEGAVLFRSGDVQDLVAKIRAVIENYANIKATLTEINLPNNAEQLLALYYELIKQGEK